MTGYQTSRFGPSPEKPNWRQVGRGTGRFAKCKIDITISNERTTSSIPSKYETILQQDKHEVNAFGNRVNRFGDSETDFPGPGTYYTPSSLLRTTVESGSVSRLGYGSGFVSKAKRFSDRNHDETPGPGTYQPASKQHGKLLNAKYGSKCIVRTTADTNQNKPSKLQILSTPGPGNYNAEQYSMRTSKNIAKSVFQSKTKRGFSTSDDTPAPGQYDYASTLANELKSNQNGSSAFRSNQKRLDMKVNNVPGPGAYRVEEAEAVLQCDWIAKAQASSCFHQGSSGRFGYAAVSQKETEAVGPGSYEVKSFVEPTVRLEVNLGSIPTTNHCNDHSTTNEQVAPESPAKRHNIRTLRKPPVSNGNSIFKSSVAKCTAINSVNESSFVPGPAFYHPTTVVSRSHLLNSNKKWI